MRRVTRRLPALWEYADCTLGRLPHANHSGRWRPCRRRCQDPAPAGSAPGGQADCTQPPQDIAATGLEANALVGLLVRWGLMETRFTTEEVAQKLHLSVTLARQVLEKACFDGSMEQLYQTGEGSYHYRITRRGPPTGGAVARGLRLHRPGAGQPGGLRGDAALAVRQHAAGAAGARDRRPLGPGPVDRRRRNWPAWPSPPGAACSSTGRRERQEQPRPADPRGPAGRLLDPVRHQRRRTTSSACSTSRSTSASRPASRPGRSTNAGSASAGRWSSSAAN